MTQKLSTVLLALFFMGMAALSAQAQPFDILAEQAELEPNGGMADAHCIVHASNNLLVFFNREEGGIYAWDRINNNLLEHTAPSELNSNIDTESETINRCDAATINDGFVYFSFRASGADPNINYVYRTEVADASNVAFKEIDGINGLAVDGSTLYLASVAAFNDSNTLGDGVYEIDSDLSNSPQEVATNADLDFTTASFDVDSDGIVYGWSIGSGDFENVIVSVDPSASSPSFSAFVDPYGGGSPLNQTGGLIGDLDIITFEGTEFMVVSNESFDGPNGEEWAAIQLSDQSIELLFTRADLVGNTSASRYTAGFEEPMAVNSGGKVFITSRDDFEATDYIARAAGLFQPNSPPVAEDDIFSTPQNKTLTANPPGVLENDSDPDGDLLTVSLVSDVSNGTLALDPDGSFDYAPNPGFTGTDQFRYEVSDLSVPDTATVEIEVSQQPSLITFVEAGAGLTGVQEGTASITDLNGDENKDLLLTGSSSATLYLGDGEGDFTVANAGLSDVSDSAVSIADVNGDENLDLLIAGEEANDNITTTLYLGDGQGGFSEANAGLTGVENGSASIADVNGDENPDLLITGEEANNDVTATLYLGDGQGGFSEAGANLTGVGFSSSSVADVDGDGNQDFLITGEDANNNPTATLYMGDGQGGFTEANVGLAGVKNSSAAIGDVDGDENPDLLITGEEANDDITMTLYLGDGQGGFTEADAGLTGVEDGSVSIADVDGDGNKDLLATGSEGLGDEFNPPEATTLYLGDGQGEFTVANAGLSDVDDSAASIADVNGDGTQDLLIAGDDPTSDNPIATLYLNQGSSTTVSKTVDEDGVVNFGNTGTTLNFSGVGGTGTVTVSKFTEGPADTSGIAEENVSDFRFVIEAENSLDFDSTETRLAVSSLGGIEEDPSSVTIYKREEAGAGTFEVLKTSVDNGGTPGDISDDTLEATTESFSEFALASDSEPLPVEMASFEATIKDGAARLTWQTASETNNAGFEVQRRRAGAEGSWAEVGFVESKASGGTTDEAKNYRFADEDLPFAADSLSYRLRQVDLSGTATVTEAVTIGRGVSELVLRKTFPNPAQGQTTVRFAVPERRDVTLRVYDVLGREVRTLTNESVEGRQEMRVDLSSLSSGTYFLRLQAGDATETRRLIVVR